MMLWRFGGKGWMSNWMSNRGVCRTAPATPGLLISQGTYWGTEVKYRICQVYNQSCNWPKAPRSPTDLRLNLKTFNVLFLHSSLAQSQRWSCFQPSIRGSGWTKCSKIMLICYVNIKSCNLPVVPCPQAGHQLIFKAFTIKFLPYSSSGSQRWSQLQCSIYYCVLGCLHALVQRLSPGVELLCNRYPGVAGRAG